MLFNLFKQNPKYQNIFQSAVFWHILITIAVMLNLWNVSKGYSPTALDFDASTYYIPYAKQVLTDGFRFFTEEKSIRYPPLAYLYPALLGANQIAIKICNIFLSCILVCILYRAGWNLHSRTAGILAAFLFAITPQFREFIPRVLTEPLFFFFTGLWLLCVTEIYINKNFRFMTLGGIALGLAILSRGSIYYFAYAAILISAMMAWRTQGDERSKWGHLMGLHIIALVLPVILIVKNYILFDFPFFATGSGNALYFGSHPLVNGYELPYYGLGYDEGVISGIHDHLSVIGDGLLKNVALTMLHERPWADLLASYAQKTAAFVFVTKAVLADTVWNIRSLRITEVLLSLIGLYAIRSRPMQVFAGGVLFYQIAIHTPLLYSHRYSVGAIDIWLILLSAIGATAILKTDNLKLVAVSSIFIILAITAGEYHRKHSEPLSPDIINVPHKIIWQQSGNDLAPIASMGFTTVGQGQYQLAGQPNSLDIPVRGVTALAPTGNYVLNLGMSVTEQSLEPCELLRIFYRRISDSGFSDGQSIKLRLKATGEMVDYHIGATLPLALINDGDIRLVFECPKGTRININNISIAEPTVAATYKQIYEQRNMH